MEKNDRFIVVYKEGSSLTSTGQRAILVDRLTGVNYLWIFCGSAAGLTPLIDNNGKPIITEIKE